MHSNWIVLLVEACHGSSQAIPNPRDTTKFKDMSEPWGLM